MNKINDKNNSIKKPQVTGHSWDGVEEYNTPAPRWWLIVWGVTIIWSVIYWFFFPTWPTIKDHTKGSLGWSSVSDLKKSEVEIQNRKDLYLDQFRKSSFEEILKNPELLQFTLNGGKAAFQQNCAACHGTGAAGSKGFPNLNDDDWIWGGKIEDIYQTLLYGIRSGHEKARESQMPSFGSDELLNKSQIKDVVEHVRSLSGLNKPNENGKKIFVENCAVCHTETGKGNITVGAPNLTDKIWLYGSEIKDVTETVYYARKGVMPNWNQRLDDDTIRQLAIYVHYLGGGE